MFGRKPVKLLTVQFILQKHETFSNAGGGGNIASCVAHHADDARKLFVMQSPPAPPQVQCCTGEAQWVSDCEYIASQH